MRKSEKLDLGIKIDKLIENFEEGHEYDTSEEKILETEWYYSWPVYYPW